jgi:hypothetical protein
VSKKHLKEKIVRTAIDRDNYRQKYIEATVRANDLQLEIFDLHVDLAKLRKELDIYKDLYASEARERVMLEDSKPVHPDEVD